MASVHDVAAYILAKDGPMSAMKLQKLTYFSYGYHLAWDDEPMFPERFEAWANGPVAPGLYADHRGRYTLNADDINGDPDQLTASQRESIDVVLENLGHHTAHQLSEASHHKDGPWQMARTRAGARELERSNEELRDEDIADYFGALTAGAE
ncbi:type II toxin-antitoxin system antitoxin SocA domain-containing protein [Kitasatospora sp. NPDC048545]|uniref:Panacea domain-containing protein n=1 Tax=Kitasatospora sp. NPDC048545 TaxID=3157208 RepID=UPI0033D50485